MYKGFFGVEDKDILPKYADKHLKRKRKIANNLANLAETTNLENFINEEQKKIESELQLNSMAENLIGSNKQRNRRILAENLRLEEKIKKNVISSYLSEMTFNSLVLDRNYLNRYEIRNNLKTKFTDVYNKLFDEKIISFENLKNSQLMEESLNELTDITRHVIKNKDKHNILSEDITEYILNEAKRSKNNAEEVSSVVEEKVKDIIAKEKEISKKKEEDNSDEEAEAADSLDEDIDETDIEPSEDEETEGDEDETPDDVEVEANMETDDTETTDDSNDEEIDDDKDDSGEDESNNEDTEVSEDGSEEDETNDEDIENSDNENTMDDMEEIPEEESSKEEVSSDTTCDTTSANGKMKITVETDGNMVSVVANKCSESAQLNFVGKYRYKKNLAERTFFRNIFENTLKSYVSGKLSESASYNFKENPVNMDMILAESIINYTILETLYTSKILDLNPNQIRSINKTLSLNLV